MIELFILETCPYSIRVMDFLEKEKIDYKKMDITKPENLNKLIDLGGMRQVPFLYIPEKDIKMYESADIIEYLEETEK